MKTLYLKNGINFTCLLEEGVHQSTGNKVRMISIFGTEKHEEPKLIFTVKECGAFHSKVILGENTKILDFYVVGTANEIIENFDHYWNNLNQ